MPLPDEYTAVFAVPALPLMERAAGIYVADPLSESVLQVVLLLCVTAVTGTPTIDCSLESSPDGDTWAAIPGGATRLFTAGSATANADITPGDTVRVTSKVNGNGGAGSSATYRAFLLVTVTQ